MNMKKVLILALTTIATQSTCFAASSYNCLVTQYIAATNGNPAAFKVLSVINGAAADTQKINRRQLTTADGQQFTLSVLVPTEDGPNLNSLEISHNDAKGNPDIDVETRGGPDFQISLNYMVDGAKDSVNAICTAQ